MTLKDREHLVGFTRSALVFRAVHIMAAAKATTPCGIHLAGNEIVTICILAPVGGAIREMSKRLLPKFVLSFQLPGEPSKILAKPRNPTGQLVIPRLQTGFFIGVGLAPERHWI